MTGLSVTAVWAFFFGIFLGAVYDIVRIARTTLGVSSYGGEVKDFQIYKKGVGNLFSGTASPVFSYVFVFITDVLYFLFACVSFIIFIYHFNNGIFRWFFALSALFGFRAYYVTVGRVVIYLSGRISSYVKLLLNLLFFVISYPFIKLFKAVLKITKPAVVHMKTSIDKTVMKRYTIKCTKKLKSIIDFGAEK